MWLDLYVQEQRIHFRLQLCWHASLYGLYPRKRKKLQNVLQMEADSLLYTAYNVALGVKSSQHLLIVAVSDLCTAFPICFSCAELIRSRTFINTMKYRVTSGLFQARIVGVHLFFCSRHCSNVSQQLLQLWKPLLSGNCLASSNVSQQLLQLWKRLLTFVQYRSM